MKAKTTLLICLWLLGSLSAEAASIAFRVGQFAPRGKSDLWFENEETFDLLVSDFNYPFGGVEVAIELNEFVDFYLSCQPKKIVLAHLYELARDPEDCWLRAHAEHVAQALAAANTGLEIVIPEWYEEVIL